MGKFTINGPFSIAGLPEGNSQWFPASRRFRYGALPPSEQEIQRHEIRTLESQSPAWPLKQPGNNPETARAVWKATCNGIWPWKKQNEFNPFTIWPPHWLYNDRPCNFCLNSLSSPCSWSFSLETRHLQMASIGSRGPERNQYHNIPKSMEQKIGLHTLTGSNFNIIF